MVDALEKAEIEYTLGKINTIMQAMNNDDVLSVLQETDLLLIIVNRRKHPEYQLLKDKIRKILLDSEKLRLIKLLRMVKIETDSGTEYYDKTRGNDEKLRFNQEHEKEMNSLMDETRNVLASIIKDKIGETT